MRKPPRTAVRAALGTLYVAACVTASVTAVGAANYLLREGGSRMLAVGVATALAGKVVVLGVVLLLIGRGARRGEWPMSFDLAAMALIVGGVIGARAGLHAIDRVAPVNLPVVLLGATAAIVVVTPAVLFFLGGAYGLLRARF